MSIKQHLVTAEELSQIPDVPGKRFELVEGEVVEVSPASARHGLIATRLSRTLDAVVQQFDLGLVMGDNVGYVLRRGPDLVRAPDVSFVAWDSAPSDEELDRYIEGAPTLAVEIVSPNDRALDVRDKVQDYLSSGSRQVWVLWPERRSVSMYDISGEYRELGPDSTLDGGDILPGFSVNVGDLFHIHRR